LNKTRKAHAGHERIIQERYRNSEKNQIEILEMKSSVSQTKNSTENFANRVDQV
jgi:hypothetical protein